MNAKDKDTNGADAGTHDDLQSLFARTAVRGSPMDVDALLKTAALRQAIRQPRPLRWVSTAAAAALLLAVGLSGGWWAGHRAAMQESVRIEQLVEANRQQLVQDMARLARSVQSAANENVTNELKHVALLLRDDYATRIARVRAELGSVARRVNQIALAEPRPLPMSRAVMLMEE